MSCSVRRTLGGADGGAEALKSVLLQLLRDDVEFREEVRALLGQEQ